MPILPREPGVAEAAVGVSGWAAELDGGCAALGVPLAPTARDRLLSYVDLLQRWNTTYNLTAVRDPGRIMVQHLLDCLAVVPALRRQLGEQPRTLLDVGSGGGLPGVVLAAVAPQWQVTCVDTVAKKAAFVCQVGAELGLPNLKAVHARAERLTGAYDLVTCRAFASLRQFTALSRAALAADGVWMAMKGRRPDDEIAELPAEVAVFHVEQLSVPGLNAERCLVWMRPA